MSAEISLSALWYRGDNPGKLAENCYIFYVQTLVLSSGYFFPQPYSGKSRPRGYDSIVMFLRLAMIG